MTKHEAKVEATRRGRHDADVRVATTAGRLAYPDGKNPYPVMSFCFWMFELAFRAAERESGS